MSEIPVWPVSLTINNTSARYKLGPYTHTHSLVCVCASETRSQFVRDPHTRTRSRFWCNCSPTATTGFPWWRMTCQNFLLPAHARTHARTRMTISQRKLFTARCQCCVVVPPPLPTPPLPLRTVYATITYCRAHVELTCAGTRTHPHSLCGFRVAVGHRRLPRLPPSPHQRICHRNLCLRSSASCVIINCWSLAARIAVGALRARTWW